MRVLVEGLDHPEGVAVASDGSVWCGGEAGQIYRVDAGAGTVEEIASTGGFCLGLAFDAHGALFVCDAKHGAVFKLSGDRLERFAEGFRNPNALAFDRAGNLFVSESHARGEPGPGLFRFAPDGSGGLWHDEPLHFANGLALHDGALYIAETWAHAVVRVPTNGTGTREVVAQLDGVLPDGLAFDAEGRLYVACYEPSQILRIDLDGSVHTVVHDKTAHVLCHPTNVAFLGTELIAANLGRWHLTAIDVGAAGVPLPPR